MSAALNERNKENRQDNLHNLETNLNNDGEALTSSRSTQWRTGTTRHKAVIKNLRIINGSDYIFLDNEETEGSDGQAEYLFGEAELDDDDLYSMEHDNQAGQTLGRENTRHAVYSHDTCGLLTGYRSSPLSLSLYP